MDENLEKLLFAVGALAEIASLFFKELTKHGFTREEALALTKSYISDVSSKAQGYTSNLPE